jgi:hypothetical protein
VLDEVNRTLQVGEYVVSRRGVEALDKVNRGEVAKPESSGASQGVTNYNLIEEEQILAIMNTEKGENVIVNRIKVNHDKSGPMRTLIRNGGKA